MQNICFQQLSEVLIPFLALCAAIASAYAACQANKISASVRDFQEKLFLNEDEIKISQEILEKLTFYNVWCNDKSQIGSLDINPEKYGSSDNAWSAIPNEVKILCMKLQTRGKCWRTKIAEWEKDFLLKCLDNYFFDEEKLEEKILEFKEFRADLLQN